MLDYGEPQMETMMDRITTTIMREFLEAIVSGKKTIEYREKKQYWIDRLAKVTVPFELRLINGMQKETPEITVRIDKVTEDEAGWEFELHIGAVLATKNLDKIKHKEPKYWYKIYISECVLCGRGDRIRERQNTPKPKEWQERVEWNDFACPEHFM